MASHLVPELTDPALILERMDEAFYVVDRDWRLQLVNAQAEAFWGRQRSELIGRSMLELFPAFEGSAPFEAHRRAMETDEPVAIETVSTATGNPVQLHLFPNPDGISVYFRDITARRSMERELENRNNLLTMAEESAGIGIWVQDIVNGTMQATPQFFHLLGIDPIKGPVPQEYIRDFRHPEDRDRVTRGFQEAVAAGSDTFDAEYRIIRPSGEERWIFGRGRVVRDPSGQITQYSGIDLDVTERKRAEAHTRVVMGELVHRTNNLLTVVQILARQGTQSASDLDDFQRVFSDRLRGLSESTNLLLRDNWLGAPLRELIEAQIAPFGAVRRFDIDGPNVRLSAKAVQSLGLALHELCTNALKYGALSSEGGRVSIRWEMAHGGLYLHWEETGGPKVNPPRRKGFGRVVAEKMISSALGAQVSTQFLEGGLQWDAIIPSSELAQGEMPAQGT